MIGNGAVVVRLDTTAPVASWGGATGTIAGELLVIGYTLDEPAAVAARLVLADRTLTLDVFPDRLQVLLPPDTPDGLATVELDVLDDVGNAATRTHAYRLGGVVAIPEPIGGPRPSRRRPTPKAPAPQRHETPSRIAVTSSSSVVARHATVQQIRTSVSTYVVHRAASAEVSRIEQKTLTTVRASASTRTSIASTATSDRRRRHDPALLALLLVD